MSDLATYIAVRIYVEDTDAGGIVYHANYLRYMERARTEMMRELGVTKPALSGGVQIVVSRVELDYRRSAHLDDLLSVSSSLLKLSASTMLIEQRVERDGEVLVEALIKAVCVSSETHKPVRIPKPMRQVMLTRLPNE
ncbi:MAG: tol-pal system-associated acyl-CoA thioesterase [Porticoccaceae bacterium]